MKSLPLLLLASGALGGCQFVLGISDDVSTGLESEQIQANDLGEDDEFGSAVAVDGDTMIVGASQEDPGGKNDSGAAYVFVRTGDSWEQQVKLVASDGDSADLMGSAVAIDGDVAVVGAPKADNRAGAAYVFVRSGNVWSEQAKLVGAFPVINNFFGTSVAIDGDRILVGSPTSSEAFVFKRSGEEWPLEQRLFTNESGTQFGQAVALQGRTAVVGAVRDDTAGEDAGAAYVFALIGDTWEVETTLNVGVGVRTDEFGSSVALDGNTAIIGARFRDDAGDDAGSAYVFTRTGTTWSQQAKLLANEGQGADAFGSSVSLLGDVAVVGAPGSDLEAVNAGAAYLFIRDGETWSEFDRLLDPVPNADAGFGTDVALTSDVALVGCPFDDDGAEKAGALLSFSY